MQIILKFQVTEEDTLIGKKRNVSLPRHLFPVWVGTVGSAVNFHPALRCLSYSSACQNLPLCFYPGYIFLKKVQAPSTKATDTQPSWLHPDGDTGQDQDQREGICSVPFCHTHFHGWLCPFSPLSGVICALCQLKGMSQLLRPPSVPSTEKAAL